MLLDINEERVFMHFDSLAEATEIAVPIAQKDYRCNDYLSDVRFNGRAFRSWQELLEETNKYQPEIDIVEDMIRQVQNEELPKPISRKRKKYFDAYEGDDINLDRLRSGQEYWINTKRQSHQGPAVQTILINQSTPWYIEPMNILWRGVAAIVVAHYLEEAGFRTEIIGVSATTQAHGYKNNLTIVPLKEPNQPLNIQSLTLSLTSWFYRTFWFSIFYVPKVEVCSSLGTVVFNLPQNVLEMVKDPIVVENFWEKPDAVFFAQNTLKNFTQKVAS